MWKESSSSEKQNVLRIKKVQFYTSAAPNDYFLI